MTPTHLGSRSTSALSPAVRSRRGFTLIELLVVIAITAALALLALMLLPAISNSDKVLKGTEEVRSTCKVAQALAAGSRQPRGVRFLVPAFAPVGNRFATEMQLLEQPPVTILDPKALVAVPSAGDPTGAGRVGVAGGFPAGTDTSTAPFVELVYEMYTGQPGDYSIDPQHAALPLASRPLPPAGTLKTRHCYIRNLSTEQKAQVVAGSTLVLPALGAWSRINSDLGKDVNGNPFPVTPTDRFAADKVVLDFYPDAAMGASTAYRTYHAGIYGVPVPLLGQPTIPLPKDVAVDLDIELADRHDAGRARAPNPSNVAVDNYDVIFAPDGQTISVAGRSTNTGVYLWVRDVTKVTNPTGTGTQVLSMDPRTFTGYPTIAAYGPAWAAAFRLGGEHHAVGINNGYVGTAPIQWPDANGTYSSGDPFTFAR